MKNVGQSVLECIMWKPGNTLAWDSMVHKNLIPLNKQRKFIPGMQGYLNRNNNEGEIDQFWSAHCCASWTLCKLNLLCPWCKSSILFFLISHRAKRLCRWLIWLCSLLSLSRFHLQVVCLSGSNPVSHMRTWKGISLGTEDPSGNQKHQNNLILWWLSVMRKEESLQRTREWSSLAGCLTPDRSQSEYREVSPRQMSAPCLLEVWMEVWMISEMSIPLSLC